MSESFEYEAWKRKLLRLLVIPLVAVLVVGVGAVVTRYYATLPSDVHTPEEGIELYFANMTRMESFRWGRIEPSQTLTTTTIIKNVGGYNVTLSFTTLPSPPVEWLQLSWNYSGVDVLHHGDLLPVEWRLYASDMAPQNVTASWETTVRGRIVH